MGNATENLPAARVYGTNFKVAEEFDEMASHKLSTLLAVGFTVSAIFSPPASAQSADDAAQDDMPRMLRVLDTNGDGKVSLEEIADEQKRLIGAADLNGDGKLSVEEFRRRGKWFQALHTTTFFDLMDVNGDQSLSAEEISNPTARWFKRYDGNADGDIVPAEVPQFRQQGKRR